MEEKPQRRKQLNFSPSEGVLFLTVIQVARGLSTHAEKVTNLELLENHERISWKEIKYQKLKWKGRIEN